MFPEKPDFTTEIKVEKLYQVLVDCLDKSLYKDILYKIYEKATKLETKRQELLGKIQKKEEEIAQKNREIQQWGSGNKNIFRDSFTKNERESILDAWITMIHQHGEDNTVENITQMISETTSMHKNGARSIAKFMEDMVESAKGRLIPQDEVYLDPRKLSENEINKLRTVMQESTGEVIKLPKESMRIQGERINFPGNHILLDTKRMEQRHVNALKRSLERTERKYISLPAHYLAAMGESINKSEIQTQRFPEEKPGGEPEEADPNMYGEDNPTGSRGEPNDELPFN